MLANLPIEDICYSHKGFTIHGLAYGHESDDIVLCLHGWLDNAASFLPMLPLFTNKRVIAIDWPGHGYSSHRSFDAHYHFIDWVYDLVQLFEINQWKNIDVVGHSMGGMVASAFAAAFPEKVKSLTLIDTIGFISMAAEQSTTQLRQGMLSRLKGLNKIKSKHISEDSAVNARVSVSDLNYEQAALIIRRGIAQQQEHFVWRADSRLRAISPYRLTLAQAEQFIRDIKIPVQLIYGSKGHDMVVKGVKHFGPLFERFISHKLKGGHHVHMEQPQATVRLINEFI
ncbi:MAG: pimeloyl-ACP methyl ester carboxylesterase [Alteromonadaceae bacterium]|jgi:pimeloyl-ACP methyl ester carboxylesterase